MASDDSFGLVGHDATLAHWRELFRRGRLPSVLLLEGREGIGKSTLLKALAAMHVCEKQTGCGACGQCRMLLAGLHPEVLWLDDPAGTGKLPLEAIAELQEHLELSPAPPVRFRLVVLVDADRMTTQAANSLLKILEEPPPAARILLSTSRPKAMLETILSRCVKWRVAPPTAAESLAWMTARAKAEDLPATPEALEHALKRAALAPGAAWRLFTQGDAEVQLKERLTRLMTSKRPDEIVQEVEALVRDSGWGLADLLGAYERELNARYAQGQGEGALRLSLRREKLRELKALAVQARIALGPTLALESLALTGI